MGGIKIWPLGSSPSGYCRNGKHIDTQAEHKCKGMRGNGIEKSACTCRCHGKRGFMPKQAEKAPILSLSEAYMCADLEQAHISTNPHRCPVCFSQVVSLAKVLNREEGK